MTPSTTADGKPMDVERPTQPDRLLTPSPSLTADCAAVTTHHLTRWIPPGFAFLLEESHDVFVMAYPILATLPIVETSDPNPVVTRSHDLHRSLGAEIQTAYGPRQKRILPVEPPSLPACHAFYLVFTPRFKDSHGRNPTSCAPFF